jgi:hypothetical protein
MNTMLRTSAIVVAAVVTALFVEDRLHRPAKDEDLAQRIEELRSDGAITVVSYLARDGQPLPVVSRL